MIRRPPRSTLFPLHDALPISRVGKCQANTQAHYQRQVKQTRRAVLIQVPDSGAVKKHNGNCREEKDRKSTRLNSSHLVISYAVFCLKKKKKNRMIQRSAYHTS